MDQAVEVWGLERDPSGSDAAGFQKSSRESTIPGILRFWPRIAARLMKARIPFDTIVHTQRPEELLPFILLRPRARLVVTIHGPHWRTVKRKYGAFAERIYLVLSAIALLRADYVIAVSSGIADELGRLLPWLKPKIRVIPPMVDESVFCPISMNEARNRLRISASAHLVLYCGRLEKEKHLPLLLSAVSRVRHKIPTTELMICGSGSEEESVRSEARSLGIPTTFLGQRRLDEMPWIYASADVLVLSSEYEGLPTVVLEALACGRPVVSKSFPGLDDLGDVGGGLELVSSDDDGSEFASRIESVLLKSSTTTVPSASLSDFSDVSVVKRILLVYRGVVEARGTSSHVASSNRRSIVERITRYHADAETIQGHDSATVFVSNYSPMAVGGVGQFMIDLGAQLINRGLPIAFCYRYEPPEFELPARVASAQLIEIRGGPNPGLQTLPLLWRTAVRLIAARSRIGLLHLVVPQPMTAVAAVVAKIINRPMVATVFAPYPRKTRKVADYFHRMSEKLVFHLADEVVYECDATRIAFSDRRGVVIFNGIDTAYYRPDEARRRELRLKLGIEREAFVAVYVGRIAEGKGVFDLLEAFAGLPKEHERMSRLILVGPVETDIAPFLSSRPTLAGRVILIGPVGKDQVRDYYQLSDAFVLPSYQEGISSSLVEAMACSLPAVVSDVGGNPEVVVDQDCGFVVAAGHVNGLRAALVKLVEQGDLRLAMARRARERTNTFFAIEAMTRGYLSEYVRLVNKQDQMRHQG